MRLLTLVVAGLALVAMSPFATVAQEATPAAEAGPGLAPILWQLEAFVAPDGTVSAVDQPANYTLQVDPSGQVNILADCNRGFGGATVTGNEIDLGPLATSQMACPEGSRDADYLIALDNATTWAYDGANLVLSAPDGSALRFSPTLTGVVWQWQGTQMMNDTVIASPNPSLYTLELTDDGRVAAQADCNRAIGSYTVDGAQIDIKALGMTRMMCPEGSMDIAYVQNLNDVVAHTFRDGRLFLDLPVDSGILEFVAVSPQQVEEQADATPSAG